MELVEGETLHARLRGGPLPLDDALAVARQIAAALDAAHEKGVVHRDLKPGNVMVTRDGVVKVLDFGLAKASDTAVSSADIGNSPTMTGMGATRAGLILGTAAYMSPEQARGRPVDKRTDVWAFGCVLYELLTGKPAFGGDDTTEILAAVVKSEPDWNALPPGSPISLLKRCLEKDPRHRLRDIGDAVLESDRRETVTSAEITAQRSLLKQPLVWALMGITGAAVLFALGNPPVPDVKTPVRLCRFPFLWVRK